MKKLFLVVLLSSFLMCNANAFTNDLVITKSNYYVCDNSIKYPIYLLKQQTKSYYYLNMSQQYNFDFRDYEEINFNDINVTERVRAFTSFRSLFTLQHDFSDIYESFAQLMIFRYLNNNDELYLCDQDLNRISYGIKYEENYQAIKRIVNGPDYDNPIRMIPNEDNLLIEPNLSRYNFESLNNLNVYRISEDTLVINDNKGLYNIAFRFNPNGSLGELYSDNTNYLLKEGRPANEDFYFTIEIDDPDLFIYNHSTESIDLSSLCFQLKRNNDTYNFCSNSDGIANIRVPKGVYNLVILSDINNDYSNNPIAMNEVKKIIDINWGSDVVPNNDNNIGFIPSDTLELSGIIIALITMLGLGYAIKKTH